MPGLGPETLVLVPKDVGTPDQSIPDGTPMLLVQEVGPSACRLENARDRTLVATEAVECRFRILMVPFRMGEAMSTVSVNAYTGSARLEWTDQIDELQFEVSKDNRTRLKVLRYGEEILQSR